MVNRVAGRALCELTVKPAGMPGMVSHSSQRVSWPLAGPARLVLCSESGWQTPKLIAGKAQPWFPVLGCVSQRQLGLAQGHMPIRDGKSVYHGAFGFEGPFRFSYCGEQGAK